MRSRHGIWRLMAVVSGILAGFLRVIQLSATELYDADYYWHATLGRYILEHKSIFREDIFSWIAAENGWTETAHSWLGSVVIALFSGMNKEPFIGAIVFSAVSTAVFGYIMARMYGTPFDKNNPKYDLPNMVFSLVAGSSIMLAGGNARPGNIGIILFLISMYLLHDGFEHPESRKCWWLPLVSVLWANAHGGSVPILFAFNGLFLVMAFFKPFNIHGIGQTFEYSKKRIRRFVLLLAADIAAAALNPYGVKLFIYFFVTNNEITKKYITEWQPAELVNVCVVTALAMMTVIIWMKRDDKTVEVSYLLPFMATLVMSGKYVRIVVYLVVCTVILLHHGLRLLLGDKEPVRAINIVAEKFVPFLLVLSLVSGIEAMVFTGASIDKVNPDPITAELVSVIDEAEPERMYTDYNVGGFAIYHGYPSFIDSRADLFPSDMLERAMLFSDMRKFTSEELKAYIDEYDFDSFLLYKEDSLWLWLDENPDWQKVYCDDKLVFFAKAEQHNA